MQPLEKAEYLTAQDVCKRFRITTQTLWRWSRDTEMGFPKPRYFVRRRRYLLSEIEAWEAGLPRSFGSEAA